MLNILMIMLCVAVFVRSDDGVMLDGYIDVIKRYCPYEESGTFIEYYNNVVFNSELRIYRYNSYDKSYSHLHDKTYGKVVADHDKQSEYHYIYIMDEDRTKDLKINFVCVMDGVYITISDVNKVIVMNQYHDAGDNVSR